MSVVVEREPDSKACVVRLDGEIDLSVVPDVRDMMESAISGGCVNVVLDLERVTYADSTALGLLVWTDHQLAPRGGKLILAGANKDVTRILELSGLVGVAPSISAKDSVADALDGLDTTPLSAEMVWEKVLSVPASIDSLGDIRKRVADLLVPLEISESSLFDIKVAVGEALANAVRHGSPRGMRDEVNITVGAYDDRVVIEVLDKGTGFDAEAGCDTDVYAAGGRGIMFMRALMDQVEFRRCDGGGTGVKLVKRFHSA